MRYVIYGGIFLAIALGAVVFTGVVEVRDVRVANIPDFVAPQVDESARAWLDERTILIRRSSVLPVVRTDALVQALAEAFPELASISVRADLPHAIEISATERLPVGIWCRADVCRFWDRSGTFWGTAVESVGPLLMLIRDQRAEEFQDEQLLPGILTVLDGLEPLGLKAKYILLPDAEPGGMRIPTNRGWDLLMDASGDVQEQLSTLGVFLADTGANASFHPAYIDLRTPGRVYFQ